mmetsp:Transcript_112796/g.364145  ORF Transcript_112796/g.364145 Transcript_112796/m.364145 type:complete len:453 (+) Transcript_112796:229-1587(+)
MLNASAQMLPLLCLTHGLRSAGVRTWTFVLPVFLARVSPGSLAPISALSLVQALSVVLLAPAVAHGFASAPRALRWPALCCLVLCENLAAVVGGALVFSVGRRSGDMLLLREPLFWGSLCLFAVNAAISSVLTTFIQKECTRCLFAGQGQVALARANAWMTRADLATSVASYALLGATLQDVDERAQAALAGWCVLATLAVLASLRYMHRASPELRSKQEPESEVSSSLPSPLSLLKGARILWALDPQARSYAIAMACLNFTVLSPSSLLSAWLRSHGVQPRALAAFRGASELAGCLGTLLAPAMMRQRGAARAGLLLQRGQLAALLAAGAAFCKMGGAREAPVMEATFMGALALSRVGLWGFDLCERQLVQTAAEPSTAVLLFSFESAAAEAAVLCMLAVSLLFSAASQFGVLVGLSVAAVGTASALLQASEQHALELAQERDVWCELYES